MDRYNEDEQPLSHPISWFALLDSWELNKSEAKSVSIFEHDLVLFRGESGSVNILDAYCPHNGANLGVGGTVDGDCIRCPFHCWKFDGSGKCTAIPGLNSKSLPEVRTRVWPCMEVDNLIMVWYHPAAHEPKWRPLSMESIAKNNYEYRGKCNLIANCCIQEYPENVVANLGQFNQLDLSRQLLGLGKLKTYCAKRICKWFSQYINYDWQTADYETKTNDYDDSGHMARQFTDGSCWLFGWKFAQFSIRIKQIGPALAHISTRYTLFGCLEFTALLISTCTPMGAYSNSFCHRLYMKPGLFGRLFAKIFIKTLDIMLSRDLLIWNDNKYLRQPILTKNKTSMLKFRLWYKQFLYQTDNELF
ncbi:cholesterol 7-desaturase nvd 1-like [Oppia nitens]|uniref:cholesterol 7-desaturase nvd 1-like n=1 Tax=Oppia nitens TaxID=1686743 RepID=UPI0023DB7D52|nr:cholesterol 7-desaturase nvd 1-like [Oppia nitens]